MSFLRIKNLCLKFGDWTLDVSIELGAGRCLGIIGPSGAGKSTLLSLIAGFETPYSGDIFIDAHPINDLEPSNRPLTFMFQENNLFNHLTLYENIALGCHPGLKLTQIDRDQIEIALSATELSSIATRKPSDVSGGERQRAALARCLCQKQPLLLLDEPFASLDPRLRSQMHQLVNALRKQHGLTVLVVSHMPHEVALIADELLFMQDGKIKEHGNADQLLENPTHPQLINYLEFTSSQ